MPEFNFIELIGYLGSVIIAVSLTMTSMVKLRWLNLIGSIIFTIYGVVINAIPVAAVNLMIVVVNIVFMIKLYTKKDYFQILEINQDSQYLKSFLGFYEKLIRKDFPNFETKDKGEQFSILILRNMAVAGVFLGKKEEDKTLEIEMDFVIPQYRDFKPGHFLLVHNQSYFLEKGIQRLRVKTADRKYSRYYRKMGFQEVKGQFIKEMN